MTPQDHNKVLGIMHLIYGGFMGLMTLMMVFIFAIVGGALTSVPPGRGDEPPVAFILAIFGAVLIFYAILAIPSLLAGYALLKRKSWARIMGIISAILSAMSFPFGTALCVYSLWFFFGEGSKFYEGGGFDPTSRGALRDAPSTNYEWERPRQRERESEPVYTPPPQPPDWRG
jgi:hypothetical protein